MTHKVVFSTPEPYGEIRSNLTTTCASFLQSLGGEQPTPPTYSSAFFCSAKKKYIELPGSVSGILSQTSPSVSCVSFGDEDVKLRSNRPDRPSTAPTWPASQVGSSFLDGALDRFAEYLGSWKLAPVGCQPLATGFGWDPRTGICPRFNNLG